MRQLHEQRKLILIVGPTGVGKSALVTRVADVLPMLVCPQSERLTEIFDSLERQLRMGAGGGRLNPRKSRLLRVLAERNQTVVFDGVGWTTPKLCSFFKCVSERVPVWIVARSDHSWDIGHVWPLLARFVRVELCHFRLADTRKLVQLLVQEGGVSAAALDAVGRLQHLSAGNPQVLHELLEGLASGRYDPHKWYDLKLLELDRRIKHLPVSNPMPSDRFKSKS